MILTIACAEDSMSEGKIQRKVLDTIDFDAIIRSMIAIGDRRAQLSCHGSLKIE
jgi:hypothetical protein